MIKNKSKEKKICPICEKIFYTARSYQIYCSKKCERNKTKRNMIYRKKHPLKEKICPVCGKEFIGIRTNQKLCSEKCSWKKGNKIYSAKPKSKQVKRNSYYRRTYGINLEEYNKMLKEQNFSCKICSKHTSKLNYPLHIDHNHKTGEIRGLLCAGCNTAIGQLYDKNLLKKAIDYLFGDVKDD